MSCHACHAPAPVLREALGPAAVLSPQAVEMPSADELFPPDGLAGSGLSQDPLLPLLEGAEGLTTRIDALRTCDARAFPNAIADVKFWLTTDPATVPDEAAAIQAEISRALLARRFPARDARARAELLCPTPASAAAAIELWPTAAELKTGITTETWSYLAPVVLPRNKLVQLFGPPKCGKSFLLACMAAAITRGGPFLDGTCAEGSVAILTEDVEGMLRVVDQAGADLTRIWVRSIFAQPWPDARAVIEATSAIAVVIDSFEKLAFAAGLSGTGAHWDPARVGPLMSELAQIALTRGVAMTHHTPRATSERSRDSGAIDAGPDLLLGLTAGKSITEKILKVWGGRHGVARLNDELTITQVSGRFHEASTKPIAKKAPAELEPIRTTLLRYLSARQPEECPSKNAIRNALDLSSRRYTELRGELELMTSSGLLETATPDPHRRPHLSRNPLGYRLTASGHALRDSLGQSRDDTDTVTGQSLLISPTDCPPVTIPPIRDRYPGQSKLSTSVHPHLGLVPPESGTVTPCPRCKASVAANADACPECGFTPGGG